MLIRFIHARLLRFWDAIDDGWLRLAGYEF